MIVLDLAVSSFWKWEDLALSSTWAVETYVLSLSLSSPVLSLPKPSCQNSNILKLHQFTRVVCVLENCQVS